MVKKREKKKQSPDRVKKLKLKRISIDVLLFDYVQIGLTGKRQYP